MQGKMCFEELSREAVACGAKNACVIRVEDIVFEPAFRELCTANTCGNYGKCWTCPPDVGEVDALIRTAKSYEYALVYQTVGLLDDSFDFEGMMDAASAHNRLAQRLRQAFSEKPAARVLHLGAGGCRVCETCSKRTGEPCRYPELALPSLEAYGVHVSKLAEAAGMRYINGTNTVTYFGAVLFSL